jgi:serine/threonine protein kinase
MTACNTNNSIDSINKASDPVEECDQRYERMDKLGEGTYGVVYKSKDRVTHEVSQIIHFIECIKFSFFIKIDCGAQKN